MSSPTFLLRKISAEETLYLRQAVLRPGLPFSASQFPNDKLPQAGHFGIFEGPKVVAVGSIYPETCDAPEVSPTPEMRLPGAWRLRGMATTPSSRNKGYGAKILHACLEHAKKSGAKLVWAHARIGAEQFYLRHGLKKQGDVYDFPPVGPHYLMWTNLTEKTD